ncbi:alpha/beta hydrolase [Nocardia sp. NPDC058658]|uniref:alpha/beta hydrolase n=1 Tax=Nocardia sp. NPDC058658 TaxID=3346580 RepID=UPI003652FC4B
MRARYDEVHRKALIIIDALERGRDAATTAQTSIGAARDLLVAKKTDAIGKGFEVRDDGTCVVGETAKQRLYSSIASSTTDTRQVAVKYNVGMAVLDVSAKAHTKWVKDALTGAVNADTAAKTAIEAAFDRVPTPDSFGNASTPQTGTPQPPKDGTPQANRAWWDSLTTAQQDDILKNSPGSIGNLNGLPAPVTDAANRLMIGPEMTRLQNDQKRYQTELDAALTQAASTGGSTGIHEAQTNLDRTNQKLRDLEAVKTAIGDSPGSSNPPRYLMALDMQSGRQGRAAVAVGNPDTADHISVTTPGLGSNLESTLIGGDPKNPNGGMMGEAQQQIASAQSQLIGAGRPNEQVASVAWFGFDPPQGGLWPVTKIEGDTVNVASEGRAQEAAQPLSSFFTGLDVASEKNDPHITALGHSYGSLATSHALQEQSGVVDDVVFYGSPGLGADVPGMAGLSGVGSPVTNLGFNDAVENAGDLGLKDGHVYEMTEQDEIVGNLDSFGRSPNSMPWVTHLSTDPVTINGTEYTGGSGHSDYARNGDNNQLHRSGYNLAAIVAGLPENALNPKTGG